MYWKDCDSCGGVGTDGHDCGEDCCACEDPDDNVACQFCDGTGGCQVCLSTLEWCEANPLAGRADVERGAIEWYALDERPAPMRSRYWQRREEWRRRRFNRRHGKWAPW